MKKLMIVGLIALSLAACDKKIETKNGQEAAAASTAFLEKTAKEAGVVKTKSGLMYKVVKSGPATGPQPKVTDEVKVHYEGKLIDGEVFDSSYDRGQPASFASLQGLIPAWQEAIPLMRSGDEWIIYVPAELGYGADGQGPIPPNSALIFKIELIDVFQHPSVG